MVSASDWTGVMNLADLSAEDAEKILDLAIDYLNLYGDLDLPNMSGDTEGSKTVSLESKEKAAVFIVARAIYHSFYKDIGSTTVAGLTVTPADLMSKPQVLEAIKEAARRLVELDVDYG